jgi:hypothetical protein
MTAPMGEMPLVAPLFIQDGNFSSRLVLVNDANRATFADVTLRALDGKELARERVQFSPHSQRQVEIGALLAAAGASATSGSIVITPSGDLKGPAILSALSLTYQGSREPNYIDEETSMPSPEGSQTLQAVSDEGEGSPVIAITSLTGSKQHVTIKCLAGGKQNVSKTVELGAGETLITEACAPSTIRGLDFAAVMERKTQGFSSPAGMVLSSDASAGSFAAFALTAHHRGEDRFFSAVTFSDPKMMMSANVVFTGVPVGHATVLPEGKYVPQLAVANFSSKDAHVQVTYAHVAASDPTVQNVHKLLLPAMTARNLVMDSLDGDPGLRNSFLVTSDAAPGTLIAKLVSRSDSRLKEVELEAKDEQGENGGSHPWSLENGIDSTLLLFNHSKDSQIFNVQIGAGPVLWQKAYTFPAMETAALSLRDLIKEQVKDDKGRTLPLDVESGQLSWNTIDSGTGKGRILQSNRDLNMARNFSCGVFRVVCGASFSPVIQDFGPGTTGDFGSIDADTCDSNFQTVCNGENGGAGSYTYSWRSADPTIAAISGSSTSPSVNVVGMAAGTTTITGTVSSQRCHASGGGPANVCPTSLSLSKLTPLALELEFPTMLTGLGAMASIQANPATSNWDGVQVTETVGLTNSANQCSGNVAAVCTSEGNTVGIFGQAFQNPLGNGQVDGVPFPATHNIFYDVHVQRGSTSLLAPGAASCTVACSQTWSCGGKQIGSFTITHTFSSDTIQGTPVTRVTVAEQ